MTLKKKIVITLLVGIPFFAIGAGYWLRSSITSQIEAVAGPTLPVFPTPTQAGEKNPLSDNSSESIGEVFNPPNAGDDSQGISEPIQTKCNGPEIMTVLAIGADNDGGYYRGLADVIVISRINFVTADVDTLSIPRDLWVDIPDLEEWEISDGKINQAYFYGNLYKLEGGGQTLLAKTIYESFGLPVDHYIAVNMTIFSNIIDAVGGIDVDNPQFASDGRGNDFPAGLIHLNGERALNFSRIRKLDGVYARMDRQILILKTLFKKIASPEYVPKIPGLIITFLDQVVTDLNAEEIEMLVCITLQVNIDEVSNTTIGPGYTEQAWQTPSWAPEGTWTLEPNYEKIRGLVNEFLYGE